VSDIDTAVVDSLKVLDPKRPIREADSSRTYRYVREAPSIADITFRLPELAVGFQKLAALLGHLGDHLTGLLI
jgi:hypothetical protein